MLGGRRKNAMMLVPDDLETPAVVVDAEQVERNIARMATASSHAGVALRPHAKTHKCLPIARRQLFHGAVGLTVATLAGPNCSRATAARACSSATRCGPGPVIAVRGFGR